ncbi:DUF3885 domain-containing protein [Bacillus cereus]|uniref:DUF3885 domain-containing protein n=1 Tax=Bacillus cereus TaxID=1396 RepID=UPI0018F2B862|nr:DUF3885 domain-containing protein [Bacillus cereus]MBJ8024996.1 DUF3885 domain-containing protein [Bacillus cereus]MBJ8037472.1 DUF3885 domain-containing protein [Bacillus cereus]
MKFEKYMNKKFNELELQPSLFYHWEPGIRFELGIDYNVKDAYKDSLYLRNVYSRVTNLFSSLFLPEDEIFVIANVNDYGNILKKKLKIFSPYVKEKSILYKIQQITIPYIFPEDDESEKYKTCRFILNCKVSDIRYNAMLKSICNQDMGIKPKIPHDIFIVNINKNIIFHVYDDRGVDVIATSIKSLKKVYSIYNDWILNSNRDKIDLFFKTI